MRVHTLPEIQSGKIWGWSPFIDVILFISSSKLILCRKSGQHVWTTGLRKGSPPIQLAWSPTTQHFGLIYKDGTYQVLSLSNGRPESTVEAVNASCLGWERDSEFNANELKSASHGLPSLIEPSWEGPALAVGTHTGLVEIALFGVLGLGAVNLNLPGGDDCAVETIWTGDSGRMVAAVANGQFFLLKTEAETPLYDLSIRSARAAALIDDIVGTSRQLGEAVQGLERSWKTFAMPRPALIEAVLWGLQPDSEILEWIQTQHEAGFRRWYKAVTSSHEAILNFLLENLILAAEQFLVYFDDLLVPPYTNLVLLEPPAKAATALLSRLYTALDVIQTEQRQFESFASWLERTFADETSRPIQVTTALRPALAEVVTYLQRKPPQSLDITEHAAALDISFKVAIEHIRSQIRIQVTERRSLGPNLGHARELDVEQNVVLFDDTLVRLDSMDRISIPGRNPALGSGCVVSVDGKHIVTTNFDGKQHREEIQDFLPESVAVQRGSNNICILSEDAHHYSVL